jgi:hypothetical protein
VSIDERIAKRGIEGQFVLELPDEAWEATVWSPHSILL